MGGLRGRGWDGREQVEDGVIVDVLGSAIHTLYDRRSTTHSTELLIVVPVVKQQPLKHLETALNGRPA